MQRDEIQGGESPPLDISDWELIRALNQARDQSCDDGAAEGYKTTRELEQITGRSSTWILKRLNSLQHMGRLDQQWVTRKRLDGRQISVPAYRLGAEEDAETAR